MRLITVDDLIAHVRSRIDLTSNEGIGDTDDILPALNRGQKFAADILAKHYPEPLLKRESVSFVNGQDLYDIPKTAFEDRLLLVEVKRSGRWRELKRISYRENSDYDWDDDDLTSYPEHYSIEGRKYRILPGLNGISELRIWYMEQPEEYVVQQGRITAIDTANNRVTLDAIGTGLSTDSESLAAYVNVIDHLTGEIKATLQLTTTDSTTKLVTFKSTPTRTTVLGRSVSSNIASLTDDDGQTVSISVDDYLCTVFGTCVPQFKDPMSNFVIEYATAEMKDKLQREGQELSRQVLKGFEQQVRRTWAARETSIRIQRRNPTWNRFFGRPKRNLR